MRWWERPEIVVPLCAVAGATLVVLVAWLGWSIPSQPRVITVRFEGPLIVKLEKP